MGLRVSCQRTGSSTAMEIRMVVSTRRVVTGKAMLSLSVVALVVVETAAVESVR